MNEVAYPAKRSNIAAMLQVAAIILFIAIPLIYFTPDRWVLRLWLRTLQIAIPTIGTSFVFVTIVMDIFRRDRITNQQLLMGWAKLRRIALWYGGMAVVGIAGMTGGGDLLYMLDPGEMFLSNPPLFALFFLYFNAWAAAMIVYIAMDGSLLRDREIIHLPRRSTILLSIYTITSFAWYVVVMKSLKHPNDTNVVMLLTFNAFALITLWTSWAMVSRRCSANELILWNTGFVCWLFWFAHPIILL